MLSFPYTLSGRNIRFFSFKPLNVILIKICQQKKVKLHALRVSTTGILLLAWESLCLIPLWKECALDFYLENVDAHKPPQPGSKFKDRSQICKALGRKRITFSLFI